MPFPTFGALRTVFTGFGYMIAAETMETKMVPGQQLHSGVSVDVVEVWACVSGVVGFADIAFFDDAFGKRRLFLWRRVHQLMCVGWLPSGVGLGGNGGYLRRWFFPACQSFVCEDGEPPLQFLHELLESKDDAFFPRRFLIFTVKPIRQMSKAVVQDVLNDVPPIELAVVAGAADHHLRFSEVGIQLEVLMVVVLFNLFPFDESFDCGCE